MIIVDVQILMNALKALMVVFRLAQILLEAIHVHVILVIIWQVMDICVMVSCFLSLAELMYSLLQWNLQRKLQINVANLI